MSLKYKSENKKFTLQWLNSGFKSREDETQDIWGGYFLDAVETDFGNEDFGQRKFNLGIGEFRNWSRNYLDIYIANTELRGTYKTKFNKEKLSSHTIEWGIKGQYELILDEINEWEKIDSAGFSLPYSEQEVRFSEILKTSLNLETTRYSGFLQNLWKKQTKDSTFLYLNTGMRFHYWDFNEQLLISPRVLFSIDPQWKHEMVFTFATGLYYQPPFYRELRDFDGKLNRNIKAQRSIHGLIGMDYYFDAWARKFKFTTEVFYKDFDDLIPYQIEDVRVRYFAENIAYGYAAGVDFRLYGELVKDAESWVSLTLLKIEEDLINDFYIDTNGVRVEPGFIPRPTDQRMNFGMFFQDYLPGNPNVKVNLSFLFGTGLPFGPPDRQRYKDVLRAPPYRRVDIGISMLLIDNKKKKFEHGIYKHIKSMWVSLEVFNLFGVNNTISFLWVRDNDDRLYAVPNVLTPRRLNLKLHASF